jgi:hypothetical protein
MRRIDDLDAFVRHIEERKQALGITAQDIEAARTSGNRRTPEKREFLRRIQERARRLGVEPMPAKF